MLGLPEEFKLLIWTQLPINKNTSDDQHENASKNSETTKLKYNCKTLDADRGTLHRRNLERSWIQVIIVGFSDERMLLLLILIVYLPAWCAIAVINDLATYLLLKSYSVKACCSLADDAHD